MPDFDSTVHLEGLDPEQLASVRAACDGEQVVLRFEAPGPAFDPTATPDAARPKDLTSMQVGGLGLRMERERARDMRYQRTDDLNVLDVVLPIRQG